MLTAQVKPDELRRILSENFGFPAFRRGQEAVCRAVCEGQDVLLVMPTGSGKSLCYQLPTIALGGTALVISPLIALMEDQVAKLNAQGLRADRIHSGRGREASRAAALAYRDGKLQFLFIAPERFSVPGFPEFLARSKPCLIAVDEAHCISQWGHDFRPDYRMLQRYLPMLRPAPIIAVTATATPPVQNDVVEQLGLERPLRSIQGFRRKNIAIEVVEKARSGRRESTIEILRDTARRPAIVYVPSRSECDLLAEDLAALFPAEAYHAGLANERRQQVQERFLRGDLEVIVATIAFGMGIDKSDIRTVIHTALPGSMEAYYQEIGRAGRDGAPSRAILMHSYADRHRHDFFFDRDYPAIDVLDGICKLLSAVPTAKDDLQKRARMDPDVFDKALEKLWIHGGATIDFEETVTIGARRWRDSYQSQGEQRSAKLELMLRYAGGDGCRMASLVRYFGDRSDTQNWCGLCDFCKPDECVAQQFREATFEENEVAAKVLTALKGLSGRSTGKLHAEICASGELDRDAFEELLAAMARAGYVAMAEAVFEKDGKQIPYRTARLTRDGEDADKEQPLEVRLRRTKVEHRSTRKKTVINHKQARPAKDPDADDEPLLQVLRNWRSSEAKSRKQPAFCICSDKVLRTIVEDRPLADDDLLAISGIGPGFVKKYGAEVLAVVKQFEKA